MALKLLLVHMKVLKLRAELEKEWAAKTKALAEVPVSSPWGSISLSPYYIITI